MKKLLMASAALLIVQFPGLVFAKACLTCNFKMSDKSSTAGSADPCEDLFAASCLDSEGQPKFAGDVKEDTKQLKAEVKKARDKAAKQMGFESFNQGLASRLKDSGLELVENFPAEQIDYLVGMGDDPWGLDADSLFKSSSQCEADSTQLSEANTDDDKLLELFESQKRFFNNYHEKIALAHSANMSNFFENFISNSCSDLKTKEARTNFLAGRITRGSGVDQAMQQIKVCENISSLRRRAIQLFREEGTEGQPEKAAAFVKEVTLPFYDTAWLANLPKAEDETESAQTNYLQKLRELTQDRNYSANELCNLIDAANESKAKQVAEKFMEETALSKTAIDRLRRSFYSQARKEKVDEMFSAAKSDAQDLMESVVTDRKKRGKILDSYDSMGLFWLNEFPESYYKKDGNSAVLDIDNLGFTEMAGYIFSDPSLSFFTTLNAFYMPNISYGETRIAEQVNMMPGFLNKIEDSPYSFFGVVAHEVAHKIGPDVSKLSGYDLSQEYGELLACYKSKDSIRLQRDQEDETVADYISSEILARQIEKLPADQRRQALVSSMEIFCKFESMETENFSLYCKGLHPDPVLRVAGIYGANPSIRRVLKCEGDSPKYKSCGLSRSILDTKDSDATASTPTNQPKAKSEAVR